VALISRDSRPNGHTEPDRPLPTPEKSPLGVDQGSDDAFEAQYPSDDRMLEEVAVNLTRYEHEIVRELVAATDFNLDMAMQALDAFRRGTTKFLVGTQNLGHRRRRLDVD
jgi:hypothetical protein